MTNRIATHSSLSAFFEELLEQAMDAESVELDGSGFRYVVNLVDEFSRHDVLHGRADKTDRGPPTLTWLYAQAREAAPSQRFEAYRHLGDVALVVSGLFGSYVERERALVRTSYYVDMGRTAYEQAAHLSGRTLFQGVFTELSEKFHRIVEVLTRVAEETTLPVRRDMATLYERLLRNPESDELGRRLASQGVFPMWSPQGIAA